MSFRLAGFFAGCCWVLVGGLLDSCSDPLVEGLVVNFRRSLFAVVLALADAKGRAGGNLDFPFVRVDRPVSQAAGLGKFVVEAAEPVVVVIDQTIGEEPVGEAVLRVAADAQALGIDLAAVLGEVVADVGGTFPRAACVADLKGGIDLLAFPAAAST